MTPYRTWAAGGGAGIVQDASLAIVAAGARAIANTGETAVVCRGDMTLGPKATVKMIDDHYVVESSQSVDWTLQLQEILNTHG